MTSSSESDFKKNYDKHLKHLKLNFRPKTIDAYARAIRRIGKYFSYQINDLSEQQLMDYFSDLLSSHAWSAVKLDLCFAQNLGKRQPHQSTKGSTLARYCDD